MKQKDLTLYIVVTFFSVVVSLLLSNMVIAPPSSRQERVEKVAPITAEFTEPNRTYFNENSTNPTQIIRIGGYDNTDPFLEAQN